MVNDVYENIAIKRGSINQKGFWQKLWKVKIDECHKIFFKSFRMLFVQGNG